MEEDVALSAVPLYWPREAGLRQRAARPTRQTPHFLSSTDTNRRVQRAWKSLLIPQTYIFSAHIVRCTMEKEPV
jgi:hypothetical protein